MPGGSCAVMGRFEGELPHVHSRVCRCPSVFRPTAVCSHTCAHTRHSQPLLVPYAHADTRSHTGRHDTQALPGPDTRPARRQLEIPIQPGLHKHGLETVPAEPTAGWGSTVANGVVGSPPYPAWPCPPSGASVLKFPVEFSILWRNRGVGRGRRYSGPKTQPLAGPPAPAWTFLYAERSLLVL